ncbi:hypothetical protein MMC14_010628 [Varicellaria rhodocarpa]|nr:hypothetical protein [Varicellaria rhodocarpa]
MRNTLSGDYYGEKGYSTIETVEVQEVLKTAIAASSHSEEEAREWLHCASYKTSSDALIAIMLPLLNRLEKLDIMLKDNLEYFKRTLSRIGAKEKPFDTKSILTTLTDVMLTPHDLNDWRGMEPTFLGLFTHLPAIKAIYAYRVGLSGNPLREPTHFRTRAFNYEGPQRWVELHAPRMEPLTLQARVSNLTHIELRNCQLRTKDIENILWASKCLKTLIYEIGSEEFNYCNSSELGLQEALRPVEGSLENLWLDYGFSGINDPTAYGMMEPMSFTKFKSLKFLRIASVFLCGSTLIAKGDSEQGGGISEQEFPLTGSFPPQLEILEVHHHEHNIISLVSVIERLLIQKQAGTELTCLKSLVLQGRFGKRKESLSLSRFAAMLETAETVDVKVALVKNPRENRYVDDENMSWGLSGDVKWASVRGRPKVYPYLNKTLDEMEQLLEQGIPYTF